MVSSGFIKLHRKILQWGWFHDHNTLIVFLYLLLMANYEEHEYRGIVLKPGQLVTGRKRIAEELSMSEQTVRTALDHLKSTNEITIKTTNKFSVITVVNWEKYQCQDVSTNQQTNQQANQQLTNNQPTTNHIQEIKKENKEKNLKNYSAETAEIIEYMNQTLGTHYRPSTPKTRELIHARLNEGFTVEDFKTVIYKKANEWKGNKDMEKYLRPQTLFSTKFESYLNQPGVSPIPQKIDDGLDEIF